MRRSCYIAVTDSSPSATANPSTSSTADPEDDHIELELQSRRLGNGRVDFYGPAPTAEDFERWLDEVFEITTGNADFHRYIGNRQSHIAACPRREPPAACCRSASRSSQKATRSMAAMTAAAFVSSQHPTCRTTRPSAPSRCSHCNKCRPPTPPTPRVGPQETVTSAGERVLDGWPTPLKGYRYRFRVVDADEINAFAVPTGHIFVTRGLVESLETEDELAAILAHEIAHVESRHSYRRWRNARNVSRFSGIAAAFAGVSDNVADDIVVAMTSFAAQLFMSGHGRDREREADLFCELLPQ